ncbi:MAG: NAD-dependent epimerase/dehydratase family protein [Synechococcus sp. ELA057]
MTLQPLLTTGRPCAVLTGGTGFIGSSLAGSLVSKGYNVHILTRQKSLLKNKDKYHYAGLEADEMTTLFKELKPNVVFHLATSFVAEHKTEDLRGMLDSNISLGARILEAMYRSDCKMLVNTATSWQHYASGSREYMATNLYAAMKTSFEVIIDYYSRAHGLRAISITLFDSYGPRDSRGKLISHLLDGLAKGIQISMSEGEQRLCLVHVDDVTDALMRCAELVSSQAECSHIKYVLGGLERHSLRQIVTMIELLSSRSMNIAWGTKPYRKHEIMEPWRMGAPLPGWAPKVSLKEGLSQLITTLSPRCNEK